MIYRSRMARKVTRWMRERRWWPERLFGKNKVDMDDFFFDVPEESSEEEASPGPATPDPSGKCWINLLAFDLFSLIYAQLPITIAALDLRNVCKAWRQKLTIRLGHLVQPPCHATHLRFGPVTNLLYSVVGLELVVWDLHKHEAIQYSILPLSTPHSDESKMKISNQENFLLIYTNNAVTKIPLPLKSKFQEGVVYRFPHSGQKILKISPDGKEIALWTAHDECSYLMFYPTTHDPSTPTKCILPRHGTRRYYHFGYLYDEFCYAISPTMFTVFHRQDETLITTCHIPIACESLQGKKISTDRKTILISSTDCLTCLTEISDQRGKWQKTQIFPWMDPSPRPYHSYYSISRDLTRAVYCFSDRDAPILTVHDIGASVVDPSIEPKTLTQLKTTTPWLGHGHDLVLALEQGQKIITFKSYRSPKSSLLEIFEGKEKIQISSMIITSTQPNLFMQE